MGNRMGRVLLGIPVPEVLNFVGKTAETQIEYDSEAWYNIKKRRNFLR